MLEKARKTLAVLGITTVLTTGVALAHRMVTCFQQAQNQGQNTPEPNGPQVHRLQHDQRWYRTWKNRNVKIDPQKAQAYCSEVKPLWEKAWQIRRSIREEFRKNPPNWSAIEQKEIEFVKVRLEMKKKAYETGLPLHMRLRKVCKW